LRDAALDARLQAERLRGPGLETRGVDRTRLESRRIDAGLRAGRLRLGTRRGRRRDFRARRRRGRRRHRGLGARRLRPRLLPRFLPRFLPGFGTGLLARRLNPRLDPLESGLARLRRLGTLNVALDEHVVGPADEHKVLDVVAPHDDQLPLAVEAEGVHHAQARLARAPRAALRLQASARETPQDQREHREQHEDDGEGDGPDDRRWPSCRQREQSA
ncbi:hypothetical protein NK718_17910, partial [Alsobacter sp. SYSU M60028]